MTPTEQYRRANLPLSETEYHEAAFVEHIRTADDVTLSGLANSVHAELTDRERMLDLVVEEMSFRGRDV